MLSIKAKFYIIFTLILFFTFGMGLVVGLNMAEKSTQVWHDKFVTHVVKEYQDNIRHLSEDLDNCRSDTAD